MPSINSIAVKDYSSGDLITRSEPLVHVIQNCYREKRCNNCYAFRPLEICSKCAQMFYCSKECQRNDWIFHKNECKLFSIHGWDILRVEFTERESKPVERLLLRLILLLTNNESIASKEYLLTDDSLLSLNDIEVNYKVNEMNPTSKPHFDCLVNKFKAFGIQFSEELLLRLLCITIRYSICCETIITDKVQDIQTIVASFGYLQHVCCGLYIPLTVYSHSCSPNTVRVLNGNNVELRANQDIKKGEEITVGFIYLTEDRENRRTYLRDYYWFNCHCIRCETHSDKDFNFRQLVEKLWIINDIKIISNRETAIALIKMQESIIEAMEQIVGRTYSTLLLNYLFLLEMKISFGGNYHFTGREEIVHLIEFIHKIIIISYGTDHPFIESFNKYIHILKVIHKFN